MNTIISTINNQLQTILSLIILLENDMQQQQDDEIYQRIIRLIHEQLKATISMLEKANADP